MVRVLSWSINVSKYFLPCYSLLFAYVIFREIPVGFTTTNVWWLLVTSLVSVVCGTGVLYIKSVNLRPAPDFLKLSDEMVHSIHSLVNGRSMMCLNKRQCLDLSSKLSQTMQNIQKLDRQCGFSNSVFGPSLEHLYQILVKAKLLVDDCSDENWTGTSVFQIQNEGAFEVILMDVGFCYHAIYEQGKLSMGGEWKNLELEDLCDFSTFKPASVKDVDEDREELSKRLKTLLNPQNFGSGWFFRVYYFLLVRLSKKLRLAEYLLVKLQCTAQQTLSDRSQSSRLLSWVEESYHYFTWGREVPLGVVSGASGVCKTKWLSVPCAKKCNIPEPYFMKEAGILSHVNYPNIIKFICCGEKSELQDNFIALELMEMSLSDLIKKKGKKGIPFSYTVAVDVMAQIGRGMCYLHGRRVAHRDLKPANVVLNVLTSPHLEDTYNVKLLDFGTSKSEVDPLKTSSTEHWFGTLTHKAPEVRHLAPAKSEGDRRWRAVWFKADVWSFAVICLEVLSLKLRKSLDKEDEDLKSMFPPDCPQELVALLEDCLRVNSRARPDFLEVCFRLEALRNRLLRRLPSPAQVFLSEMSLDCSQNQFIEMNLKEHFDRQNAGVVIDDEEVEVLIRRASPFEPLASQETFRMDQAPYSTTIVDRDPEIWTKQRGNEECRRALLFFWDTVFELTCDSGQVLIRRASPFEPLASQETFRMDQAPYSTTIVDRDLEIWTKQRGNEVFRRGVEEWREECKMLAVRIRMNEDQQMAVLSQWQSRCEFQLFFFYSMLLALNEVCYRRMHYWWVACRFLVLLDALFNLCLVIYQQRYLWRLWMALWNDFNKFKLDVSFPALASGVVRCHGHLSNSLTWLIQLGVLQFPKSFASVFSHNLKRLGTIFRCREAMCIDISFM